MTTQIKAGVIAANAITATQIASSAISADIIADNAITSAKIAGNSVGISELNVSDGTNGQYLQTNGSGTLSFSTVSGYTDSDVESYLNTSAIYTDPTNDRLGIGTSNPSYPLHVVGRIYSTTDVQGGSAIIKNDATYGATFGSNSSAVGIAIARDAAPASYPDIIINSSGNVGINTTSPTAKLAVVNNSNDATYTVKQYATFGTGSTWLDSDVVNQIGGGLGEVQITNGEASRPAVLSIGGTLATGELLGAISFFRSSNTDGYRHRASIFSAVNTTGTANQHGADLRFNTADDGSGNPSERMRITSDGRVGMGTISPIAGARLDVQPYLRAGNLYVGLDSGNRIEGGNGQIYPGVMSFIAGAVNMDINHYVVVTGIGINLSAKLDSPTGDWYTNDGSVSSLSDERVKTDITDLSDGLEIVKQLRPVTFKYNDNSEDENGRKRMGAASDKVRYGFIAQEVEEVAPQYVETGIGYINNEEVDDFKSMSTTRMIPMLFKAIQELNTKLEAAEARITQLEG